MRELAFESTQDVTQAEFAEWVLRRAPRDFHFELLNGRVVMTPPAGWPHGSVESNVQWILASWVKAHKLGRVFGSSQGFELPTGDTIEPDGSFVSAARLKAAAKPEVGKFLRLVPDLVFEAISPGNASTDRVEKKAIYERNGVAEYWLADSRARELTVLTLGRNGRFNSGTAYPVGARFKSKAVRGLIVKVGDVFDFD